MNIGRMALVSAGSPTPLDGRPQYTPRIGNPFSQTCLMVQEKGGEALGTSETRRKGSAVEGLQKLCMHHGKIITTEVREFYTPLCILA